MKPVPIKLQKAILLIPGINILCLPIWFYNSFIYDKKNDTLFQTLIIIFSSSVPLVLLQMMFDYYFNSICSILGMINSYLIWVSIDKTSGNLVLKHKQRPHGNDFHGVSQCQLIDTYGNNTSVSIPSGGMILTSSVSFLPIETTQTPTRLGSFLYL